MDNLGWIGAVSIVTAGITIGMGSIAPAIGEGLASRGR
jgi:F-type H+-transporting ATPase subunit c